MTHTHVPVQREVLRDRRCPNERHSIQACGSIVTSVLVWVCDSCGESLYGVPA